MIRHSTLILGLMAICALSACSERQAVQAPPRAVTSAAPDPRPEMVTQAALRRERAANAREANQRARSAAQSPASQNMRSYLQGIEEALIARGRLRTDDGSEIMLTPEKLAEDFIKVALFDEYTRQGDKLVPQASPAPLRRWQQPVAIHVEFGDSVGQAQRQRDRAEISTLASRIQAASGHPVSITQGAGNYIVLIVNEDERAGIGPRLSGLVPGIPAGDIGALAGLSPQNFCTVFAYSQDGGTVYSHAVALIREETPARLRRSCIHEEITQGMGLPNDDPTVRPSLFNDDEEFAYLTQHDELLLKILYDPRLQPGMTEAQARPIVLQIARELLPTTT